MSTLSENEENLVDELMMDWPHLTRTDAWRLVDFVAEKMQA